MNDEERKRFNECIKSLPPRNHETPESANKTHEYPEALIPVSIAKELNNNDLKLIIKELHNISQELKTLNKRLYNR